MLVYYPFVLFSSYTAPTGKELCLIRRCSFEKFHCSPNNAESLNTRRGPYFEFFLQNLILQCFNHSIMILIFGFISIWQFLHNNM